MSAACAIMVHSTAVILLEILDNDLGICRVDWRAEGVDHFRNLCFPQRRIRKRRVHLDVIEAMAGATVSFNLVEPARLLEHNRLLLRQSWGSDEGGENYDRDGAHVSSSARVERHAVHDVVMIAGGIED